MPNIFTQEISPAFTKQSISEYFIDPMFMGEDIRGAITVRTDIKGTEKLNRISRPTMITKPKVNEGFFPNGSFELTTQDITVKPMAIEFEQNGREFWGSVAQQLLASGYKEDDVEQMSNPDIWNKIVLPIIAQAGQQDLIRQMFFNDPDSSSDNYNGYTGFFTHFKNDMDDGIIPASQHIDFSYNKGSDPYVTLHVYGDGSTTLTITVNDVSHVTNYDTSAYQTAENWVNEHRDALLMQIGVNITGVMWDGLNHLIKIHAEQPLTIGYSIWLGGTVTVTQYPSELPTADEDAADATMEEMIDTMPSELLQLNPVFMVSRSLWRNLLKTWKALGTETANNIRFRGMEVPSYEGIPIIIRPDWDMWIKDLGEQSMFRAVLTTQKNLLFATDATSDSEMMETWYNQDLQKRRYRVQYKAQTAYFHKELLVLAGLNEGRDHL